MLLIASLRCLGFLPTCLNSQPSPMKRKESPDSAFLFVAVIKHPDNSKRRGEALCELHPEDTHACLLLSPLSPLWEKTRKCCYPQWAGLPTSVNVIKRIQHRHAHRPILLDTSSFRLSPGDSALNQVDNEN